MAVLIVEKGREKGRIVRVPRDGTVTVGRDAACDFTVLGDVMVSRRHLRVIARGHAIVLQDLKSSNGTFVNGRRVKPEADVALQLEDEIRLGQAVLSLGPDEALERGKGSLSGRTIGGYRLEDRIGRGSLGTAYRACQLSLDRVVVLKLLARELASDAERVAMFESEARAAGRLNHPNVVSVFDVGRSEDAHYYSMEYMERGSVEDLMREPEPLSLDDCLRIGIDAARGLAYAERQGVVHGDIEPATLLVNGEGKTKIGDLGIARVRDRKRSGGVTPLYQAPEQAGGAPPQHASDLYALGATLFHLLAKRPPFEDRTLQGILKKHLEEVPPRLDEIDAAIPGPVADLVAALLEKDPASRPASAAAVTETLEALRTRFVEGATGASLIAVAATPSRPEWFRPLVGAGAVLVLAVVGWSAFQGGSATTSGEGGVVAGVGIGGGDGEREVTQTGAERLSQRLAEGERALFEAETYLGEHADDLVGARERYLEVAQTYSDLDVVVVRANQRAASIQESLGEFAKQREEQERREQRAVQVLEELELQIDAAAGPEVRELLRQLRRAASEHEHTSSHPQLAALRNRLLERLEALTASAEFAAHEATRRTDFEDARSTAKRLASWRLDGLIGERIATLEIKIASAEEHHLASLRRAAEKRRNKELDAIAEADDGELRRRFELRSILDRLEGLEGTLTDEEAKALLEERIAAVRASETLLAHFQRHIRQGEKPALRLPLTASITGVAFDADNVGVSFRAVAGAKIEVTKPYAKIGAEKLEQLMMGIGLSLEERYGLAHVLYDLGEVGRARRVLERLENAAGDSELGRRAARTLSGSAWGS